MDQDGPFWPEEAHFGPLRSVNRTLAMPEKTQSRREVAKQLFFGCLSALRSWEPTRTFFGRFLGRFLVLAFAPLYYKSVAGLKDCKVRCPKAGDVPSKGLRGKLRGSRGLESRTTPVTRGNPMHLMSRAYCSESSLLQVLSEDNSFLCLTLFVEV